MNDICVTCDTRNRLHLCSGKDGNFTYCFRPVGSVSNIPGNIIQFNNIDELFLHDGWVQNINKETVYLDDEYYGAGHHMRLLLGLFHGEPQEKIDLGDCYPVGFITC